VGRRPATVEETRALAHPLRLRILRLCLDDELTNKQIADSLGVDPGSTLHHVRRLVDAGFLAAGDPRQGRRGSREKPYRSTGKSWEVSLEESRAAELAMVDAFRAELAQTGAKSTLVLTRFAARLNEASYQELSRRLQEAVDDFVSRDDEDGVPMGFLVGGHVRAGERPAWAEPEDPAADDVA
jgi:DNA-binding transcriptional ArsR family regulator